MTQVRFSDMLTQEEQTARLALLTLYIVRDRLLYVDAPQLNEAYEQQLMDVDNQVLTAELDFQLLLRKRELVQAALNRREPLDLAAIDAALAQQRESLLQQAAQDDADDPPTLPEEALKELQALYEALVQDFHPGVHSDLTGTQRDLFDQACDAYRLHDLDALHLAMEALRAEAGAAADTNLPIDIMLAPSAGQQSTQAEPDFTLAQRVYPCFVHTTDDLIHAERCQALLRQRKATEAEIARIRTQHPFDMQDVLSDPAMRDAYIEKQKAALRQWEEQQDALSAQIDTLVKGRHM